jgi:hypothetical protein
LRQLGERYFKAYISPKTGRALGTNERDLWNVMIETKVHDRPLGDYVVADLKKLHAGETVEARSHTTIQRIDAQRRESCKAANLEREVGRAEEKLAAGATRRTRADKIGRQREVGRA